jgi:hypothetical protein
LRRPNLFIPGFPKSGTSALHSALIQHPEISMGVTKEPHTYSWDNRYKNKEIYFKKNYDSLSSKYILDSSTSYMVSKDALKRIIKDTPNAKFIVVARDPIDRIVSHYNWLSSKNLIDKNPKEELKIHSEETFNYKNHYKGNFKAYQEFSLYGKHINSLLKLTSKDNILFFTYEKLFKDFENQKLNIAKFLNLDLKGIKVEKVNKTDFKKQQREYSSPIVRSVIPTLRKGVKFKNSLKYEFKVLKGHPRGLQIKSPIQYKTSREEIENLLLPVFKGDIKLLQQMGYNVDAWQTTSQIVNK